MSHLSKFLRLRRLQLLRELNDIEIGVDQDCMIYVKPKKKKKA